MIQNLDFRKYVIENKLGIIYKIIYRLWKMTTKHPVTLEKPIFIIGCPRSGTTIAKDLFDIHPNLAVWSEAGIVWDRENYYNKNAEHYWPEEYVTRKKRNY